MGSFPLTLTVKVGGTSRNAKPLLAPTQKREARPSRDHNYHNQSLNDHDNTTTNGALHTVASLSSKFVHPFLELID
jgi:hypothetical protein